MLVPRSGAGHFLALFRSSIHISRLQQQHATQRRSWCTSTISQAAAFDQENNQVLLFDHTAAVHTQASQQRLQLYNTESLP